MQLTPASRTRLIYLGSLIALESGIYYGIWGLPLLYLIPSLMLFDRNQHIVHVTGAYRIIPLIIIMGMQIGIVEWYILGLNTSVFYTIVKLFGTILVGIFFSLTNKSLGTLGNRSYV